MKLGVWIYLLMIIAGVISYYCSEPLMRLMPQDKDGNIPTQYSFVPVLLDIGGLGMAFFGLLYANFEAKEELQRRFSEAK